MEAEGADGTLFPEVEAAGNLGVVAGGEGKVGGMVDVGEEEGGAPVVGVEAYEGGGEMTTVEVVHLLDVGLSTGIGCQSEQHGCKE